LTGLQTLFKKIGLHTPLAGHTRFSVDATGVPRSAAFAKPFEGFPRGLAMLAIYATPNGTFAQTNLSNITAKRTSFFFSHDEYHREQ